MRITGLSLRDQIAVIRTQVDGPVASALALLKEPAAPSALHASDRAEDRRRRRIGCNWISSFRSMTKLQIDDVQIHADAHLAKGPAAGYREVARTSTTVSSIWASTRTA